ncbi:HepT-like ribonuclease domain-containing protein [Methanoregula formicica]|uniref:Nucleotidyltransferase n=1 Tax=Methanoregula formicica (strain DSM 22288 / NBRC 105244 / SMSP) TaxID=593750 RepID=L0HE63_METFS|nr:DUF86 domain-containing protein [Methanoregula formicica]AGB02295.1 hypothetical protein Metfor_1252 [Methanoregula formicica SMSP]
MTFEEFKNDRMRIDAVVRNFEIVGEATNHLSPDLKARYPNTDWKSIAGFRDTLIHGYFGVDLEILWDIIVNKIPLLQVEIAAIVAHEKGTGK